MNINIKEKCNALFQKKNTEISKRENRSTKKSLQNGSYMASVTAIAIVLIFIVNLIVKAIPVNYTEFDLTTQKLYTIGDQTEELVKNLDEDVTLYYLMRSGEEDETLVKLLERYDDLSSHLTVVHKDVVKYPNFISSYTEDSVSLHSIIVECGDRFKLVDYNDIYPTTIDYYTYSYATEGFDGEGQLTSAIAYVTGDDLPKMYVLEGHNEMDLSSSIQSAIEKENIQIEQLSLLTLDGVPEDADCLMIHVPTVDFSAEETEKIMTYLENGGKAIIISGYTGSDMPNFDSIMESYGVEKAEGIVFEGSNQNYISGTPYYVVPEIEYTEITSDMVSDGRYILLPVAQGLTITANEDSDIQVDSLLSTSDSAYVKTDVANMQSYAKEDGDIDGPFSLGVAVTKTVEVEVGAADDAGSGTGEAENVSEDMDSSMNGAEVENENSVDIIDAESVENEEISSGDKTESSEDTEDADTTEDTVEKETIETKIVYFTSEAFLDDSVDSMVSGGNSELFMNSLSWLVDHEVTVSIDMKSTDVEYITMTSGTASMLSILTIGVVPVVTLIGGFVVWMKRRKQ